MWPKELGEWATFKETSVSRKPDYRIKALRKSTNEKQVIGAGWINEDGSISLVFDPFVQIPVGSDVIITAFIVGAEKGA